MSVVCVALGGTTAIAGSLPAIKLAADNSVPACTTPQRLMAFLKTRNANLDPRFENVAALYKKHGAELAVRWDVAFFQMMVETGQLSFKRDGKPSRMLPTQNNFANLPASTGEASEAFASIDHGVKAHLQHVAMYAGDVVDQPIADRTRKVQDWGVLKPWQRALNRPTNFTDLTQKWAPHDPNYATAIESLANSFNDEFCGQPMTAKAAGPAAETSKWAGGVSVAAAPKAEPSPSAGIGAELARQALERARAEGNDTRSGLGLGARSFAQPALPRQPAPTVETAPPVSVRVINSNAPAVGAGAGDAYSPAATKSVVAAAVMPPAHKTPSANREVMPRQCRVFSASYGGGKSVIIRQIADQYTNYTVLEVSDADEGHEVSAFINAYARNGKKIAEYRNQPEAMDEAFKLCPEG